MLKAFFFSGRLSVSQATPSCSLMSSTMSLLSGMVFLPRLEFGPIVPAVPVAQVVQTKSYKLAVTLDYRADFGDSTLRKTIEAFGVIREDLLFGLVRNIFAPNDLTHGVGPLGVPMWIVRCVHHALVAKLFNNERQSG